MTPHFVVLVLLIGAGFAGLVVAAVFWQMRNGGHLTRLLVRSTVTLSFVEIAMAPRLYRWDDMPLDHRVILAAVLLALFAGSVDAVVTLLREMRGRKEHE